MIATRTKEQDRAVGKASEKTNYDLIKQIDSALTPTPDRFNLFDFESPASRVELKTRNVCWRTYPTIVVGTNKVKVAENDTSERVYYFAYSFLDGLYYIKYNKELFSKFKKGKMQREDRGETYSNEVLHIPTEKLIRIYPRNENGSYTISFD